MQSFFLISVVLLATCVVADLMVRLMIRLAPVLGLMDLPGERRIHTKAVPRVGGVAVFLALLAGIGMLCGVGLLERFPSYLAAGDQLWWLMAGALVLVVTGVVDDRHDLSAWWKLGAEVLAATLVFVSTQRDFGGFMGFQVPWWVDYGIFVVWVVALVNAFNLIDGMDGLCGGLGFIATGILGLLSLVGPAKGDTLILAVMGIALLAFLRFNFHPARVFLGDAGSMLIGYLIATAGTLTVGRRAVVAGVLLPLLVAGVPLFDVMLAIWRRSARKLAYEGEGRVPRIFGADKDHLHHRLLSKGFGQRQVALLIYGIALLLSLIALLPVLAGTSYLAFSILGMIVTGLLGLRFIARIELVESREGMRAILFRPVNSGVVAIGYFMYDMAVLVAGVWFAMWLVGKVGAWGVSLRFQVVMISTFVACGLLGLRFGGAHSRHWARAGVADFVSWAGWLGCGLLLSFGFLSVFFHDLSYRVALTHLAGAGVATIGLLLPRCFGIVLRESAVVAGHRRHPAVDRMTKRTLLYGAGNLGELFVFSLGIHKGADWAEFSFVGFIDDKKELKGRVIRGFPVLGSLDEFEVLVARHRVGAVLVTMTELPAGAMSRLVELADAAGVEIYEWKAGLGVIGRAMKTGVVAVRSGGDNGTVED